MLPQRTFLKVSHDSAIPVKVYLRQFAKQEIKRYSTCPLFVNSWVMLFIAQPVIPNIQENTMNI